MSKNQLFNLFTLKKSTFLIVALVIVSFVGGVSASAQSIPGGTLINGIVKESKGSLPLPGVAVVVKGTTVGTTTDINGNFSLTAKPTDVLLFKYIGFTDKEVQVGNNTFIEVMLAEDLYDIDEVVVTGYGVQRKSDLTGSVASVSAEKLSSIPIPNVEQALQGMAAGVNIIPKSGRPGSGVDIQIRGISSINGTSPLVIIDGVSGSLNNLNPADIASIEVLKDASSAAIYGATGGNGVILVTTKNGKSGKMRVSANVYRGFENPVGHIEMMNAQEYLELCEEMEATKKTPINTQRDTLQTYDWQDIMFKQAISENYNISISGGNDVSTFMFSSSLDKQNGIVKGTDYQRFTLRINSEHKVNKYLVFDEKVTFVNSVSEGIDEWAWHHFYNNPVVDIIVMDPTVPAYDQNGIWSVSPRGLNNPQVPLDMKDKINRHNNFEGNFGMKISLFKGLDYHSRITGKIGFSDSKEYQGIYWASPTVYNTQDKLLQSMDKSLSYNFQNYVSYQTTIAQKHNVYAMVGMEASKWWGYNIFGTRVDMASTDPNMLYLSKSTNGDADIQNVQGTGYIGANQGYFGRLNYDYLGRYLLTVNVRRDGSSSFGPENRWGTFPSFSLGWKFAEEEFMKNVPYISTGKIRFGYGQTGANARGGFPYLSTVVSPAEYRYTFDGISTQVGTAPLQIANPALRWESVNMSNLGLDMTFFDNRISLTADVFDKVNDGMIMIKETSVIAGTHKGTLGDESNPEVNFGSISNKGLEITLGARKNRGDLTGSFDLNFSTVRNEVLSLAADSMRSGAVHNVQPTNLTRVGSPVAQFWGYELEGMFSKDDPTETVGRRVFITNQPYYLNASGEKVYAQPGARPGDARFKDNNGDGRINDNDKVLLGSPLPKLTFGFSINLEYKGLDFSAFFNGTYGNKIMNGTKQYLYNPVGYQNRGKVFADRYRDEIIKDGVVVVSENHDTDIYRVSAETYTRMSSFFVEDGSYLRLRNVVLGYTLPNTITSKIGVEKLRVYAGGRNLFTLTNYTGFNPEIGGNDILNMGVDIGLYPVTKMVYFGANIVF
jgi:TonB-dependent starch-binding outer membrane protein SusC